MRLMGEFWTQVDDGCWRKGQCEIKRCRHGAKKKSGALLTMPGHEPRIFPSVAHAKAYAASAEMELDR